MNNSQTSGMKYVIGLNKSMALDWCRREGLRRGEFRVLSSEGAVRGLHAEAKDELVYVGPVYERRDFRDIEYALIPTGLLWHLRMVE